jgi:hypothetical protein
MVFAVFGYFANEKWLLQEVINRQLAADPDPQEYPDPKAYADAVDDLRKTATIRVAAHVKQATKINGLRLGLVWVARKQTMLCWQLPEKMRARYRSEEGSKALGKLYNMAKLGDTFEEPQDLASVDGPLPRHMRRDEVPLVLQTMRF